MQNWSGLSYEARRIRFLMIQNGIPRPSNARSIHFCLVRNGREIIIVIKCNTLKMYADLHLRDANVHL